MFHTHVEDEIKTRILLNVTHQLMHFQYNNILV